MRDVVRGLLARLGNRLRSPRAGTLAVLTAALAAVIALAPATAPAAAAATTAATATASATVVRPTTSPASSAHGTPAARGTHKQSPARPRARAGQLPLAHQSMAAPSAATIRQRQAQAARQAIGQTTVPNICTGPVNPISPDTIYPCSTPSATGTDTFTFTLSDASDLVFLRVQSTSDNALGFTLTAPDNMTAVNCQNPTSLVVECPTSQMGTYTLAVSNGASGTTPGTPYTVEFTPLVSDTTCTTIDPSFKAPPTSGSLADGQTGACYALAVSSGSVITAAWRASTFPTNVGVFDATGKNQDCNFSGGPCTLSGTGPYRVFVYTFGVADPYQIVVNSLTSPAGCDAAPLLPYGQAPDITSTDPCRTLTVKTAGLYQIAPAGASIGANLYTASGSPVTCNSLFPFCQLAVGTYSYVVPGFPPFPAFGLDFIAGSETMGCAATGDTDFQSGPATGSFTGIGDEVCLTLPTPAGQTDYIINQPPASGNGTSVTYVLDKTGALACTGTNGDFTFTTCPLTGTAPFHLVEVTATAPSSYRVLVQQTTSTAGCATWPQSGFGGSFGATVALHFSDDAKCLTIPAAQHSTGEMIDYDNAANVVDGSINVYDPAGTPICTGASTSICPLKSGVTYTAIVVTGAFTGDTYHIVRRDVSQTATCAAPASTAVGGPSTTFTLTSDLDTVCYRVTGATADKLWLGVRTIAPAPPGARAPASAVLQVTNASGALVCRQFGVACRVTGSADYQAIVTAEGYAGVAITTHLDTWRVGTASGWAASCLKHQFSAEGGFPVVTGTLTEQATAYCAVVEFQPGDSIDLAGSDTAPFPDTPDDVVYAPADFTSSLAFSRPFGACSPDGSFFQFGFTCEDNPGSPPFMGVLLVNFNDATSPTGFAMQGVCRFQCTAPRQPATVSAVSPVKAVAGASRKIVITGTNLTLATQVELRSETSFSDMATGTDVAVNAAGTQLTVLMTTINLTPGPYDIVLDGVGFTTGVASPGYLPNAYTVTAAPPSPVATAFTTTTPARILNTRTGLGAPKARVAAHGTVTLAVAGHGGVPASNVTAVALDVTVIGPTAAGSLIAYPAGTARPGVTSLSFGRGQAVTTLVVVPLRGGKASLFNSSGGTLDLTADVVGYYAPTATGATLTTTGPTRILDTRAGLGAPRARVAARGTLALTVAGRAGVPATGVRAVVLNVIAIAPAATGSLTIFKNGSSRPVATTLSFATGQTTYGLAVVPVASNGKISIYNGSGGTLDLGAAVVGYYGSGGTSFLPVGPERVLDTRSGLGGSGQTVLPHAAAVVANIGNIVPTSLSVSSVVLDVTVTGAQKAGVLTVLADGTSLPPATLSYAAGQTVTDLVVVPDVDGSVDFWNGSSGTIQVTADLVGYYG